MNVARKTINGFKWTTGMRLIGQLFNWTITIFVIRLLEPTDYGVFAIALVVMAFLTMLGEFGIGNGLIQKKDFSHALMRKIFGFSLLMNTLFAAALFFGANSVSVLYGYADLENILQLLSIKFFLVSFMVIPDAKLRFEMGFKQLSIIELVTAMAGGVATLFFAINDQGVWSLVYGNLLRLILLAAALQVLRPSLYMPNFNFADMGGVGGFGGVLVINRVLFFLYNKSDVLILGKLLTPNVVGIYTVAKDLASIPMAKIAASINIVGFSAFTKYDNQQDELKRHYLKATSHLALVSFPVFVGISSIAPELVPVALGEKWSGVLVCLQLIAISIPFRLLNMMTAPLLEGIGKPQKSLVNTIIALLVFLPSFYYAGINFGIVGASFVWAVLSPIYYVVVVLRLTRWTGIGISDVLRIIYIPLVAVLVMYLVIRQFSAIAGTSFGDLGLILLEITLGAIIYLSLFSLLDRSRLSEFSRLLKRN